MKEKEVHRLIEYHLEVSYFTRGLMFSFRIESVKKASLASFNGGENRNFKRVSNLNASSKW